jgi:ATP-dependent RNA helicase RhlE
MNQENTGASAPRSGFAELELSDTLLRALRDRGYEAPTPIQAQAIPHLLEGRDLLGVAQTGTGKTAAFALPMIDRLRNAGVRPRAGRPRSLILTPTRELASQIAASFEAYAKHQHFRCAVVFGGVGKAPQIKALRGGLDVLVATPGRLLDLMNQREVDLSQVEIFVLDEADRMLDMGFLRDVRKVVDALPSRRQSLLFSATMPEDIRRLGQKLLHDPVRVEVSPPSTTVELIDQRVYFVDKSHKRDLLADILQDETFERTLIFTRTKHGADRVSRQLGQAGVSALALHGNKTQGARERALASFRKGSVRALVATDIAARGLDVPGITHVINFDLPNIPESYVHRIGRTARAGKEGVAISFCDGTERPYLKDIEREIRCRIEVVRTPTTSRTTRARRDEPRTTQQRQPQQRQPQRQTKGRRPATPSQPSAAANGKARQPRRRRRRRAQHAMD